MQDQWFGDEGDFVKYTLLRKICGITAGDGGHRLRLAVVWYKQESKLVNYLRPGSPYESEDQYLFQRLRHWIEDERTRGLSLMENSFLFPPDTVWFAESVPPSAKARTAWLKRALAKVAETESRITFLDPDTGLLPPSKKSGGAYVLPTELSAFCEPARNTVVVYQHSWRVDREKRIEKQIKPQIEGQADPIKHRIVTVQHKRLTDRFFYVIPSTGNDGQLVLDRITEPPFERIT